MSRELPSPRGHVLINLLWPRRARDHARNFWLRQQPGNRQLRHRVATLRGKRLPPVQQLEILVVQVVTGTVGRPSSLPFTPCWATSLLRRPLHRSLRDPAPLPPAGVSYRQRILAVLPTLPASFTTQHVAERTGLTPEAVRKVLPRLVTNREVRRVKPGRYRKPHRRPRSARTERQKANAQRHVETAEPATPSR